MSVRSLLFGATLALAFVYIAFSCFSTGFCGGSISLPSSPTTKFDSFGSEMATTHPHSTSDIPVSISLTLLSATPEAVTLHLTFTNTSPAPVHILKWATPLDPLAPAMGIIKFIDTSSTTPVSSLDLKPNRPMPANGKCKIEDGDVVTIEAGGKLEKEVVVRNHEVQFKSGGKYVVWAEGKWLGVWSGGEPVRGGDVRLGDARMGSFMSGRVLVEVL